VRARATASCRPSAPSFWERVGVVVRVDEVENCLPGELLSRVADEGFHVPVPVPEAALGVEDVEEPGHRVEELLKPRQPAVHLGDVRSTHTMSCSPSLSRGLRLTSTRASRLSLGEVTVLDDISRDRRLQVLGGGTVK
jgi:hypothetical protein